MAGRPDVVDREQVEAAIVEVTRCDPSEDDLRQVAAKLAAGGWPLNPIQGVRSSTRSDSRTAYIETSTASS
ncbi:DUF3349 domain-containing protein [Nocardia violaceofusca]|uniref:DUF3349 domain-containing protein n=1 Tax=Nocardia violaceofusca TaxID=941182 RepID=UPI0022B6A0D3|nr:DUF3349 domain-containing protein [Nocardia violaceofusca]